MGERVFFVGTGLNSDYDTAGTITAVHTVDPDGDELAEPVIEVTWDDGVIDMLTWDDVVAVSTVR